MKSIKIRRILITVFVAIFILFTAIYLRADYLQYKELGDNYLDVFFTNLKYKYSIFGINFLILYCMIYFTNKSIKKGLKVFFDNEKKEMPKIPNKSISFVVSILVSAVFSSFIMQKILMIASNSSFGITDPVFNLDISFYMFLKPLISTLLIYLIGIIVALTVYMVLYCIIVFNIFFDGVDGNLIKKNTLINKILRNIMISVILIALVTVINITNINLSELLTIKTNSATTENIEVIGAGYTDVVLQRWAYLIFAFVIVIATKRAVREFKKDNTSKIIKNLLIIPGYLVIMFVIMIVFDLMFVNSNTLDKERANLENNIKYTKNAFNIDIEEDSLQNLGTITANDVVDNNEIIDNIKIVNSGVVLNNLRNNQTGTGYYSYRNVNLASYNISGKNKLVYVAPREIANRGRTYNNKTYEYTHGMGQIVVDSTSTTDIGGINYLQKELSGEDDVLGTKQQEIYFGLETNDTIATNIKNKREYDYTDEEGKEHTSIYTGKAGLQMSFLDRLVLGIKTGDLKLAFSGEMTEESKVLINRNIIARAKKAMPYLVYDQNPYTVVTSEGKLVWVLDAYTISNSYPYSQYISIEHDNIKEKINYIRNSVKVIVDSYDGTMKFYITDKTDPIAMGYRNIYTTLFEDINEQIPSDISEHFIYPKYLYNVQAELLKIYHNVKYDVLYRTDDLWDFAKYNSTIISKSTGTILEPYYALINNKDKIGLVQVYTPDSKQNLISYLVGTVEGSTNKLKLYKYSQDSNVLGPMQLDNQIEQDEAILSEINSLNTLGARVTKDMIVIPINNKLLYVESIYQTMLNEEPRIPLLKKVVVASGNKLAIGDNLSEALNNLLSKEASNIEVENTDDIDGLIDAIVRANKNLSESVNSGNWGLMGSDIGRLQTLIDNLEKLKAEEDKKKEEENNINDNSVVVNNVIDNMELNSIENKK